MADAPEPPLEELPLDDRRRAADPAAGDRAAGAAEPDRGLRRAARRRHRRLGRRLAGHDRPRQPGGAVAGARAAARRDREPRPRARAAADGLPGVARRASGSTRRCCRACSAPPTRSASRARTPGRRASRATSRSSRATRCRSTRATSSARTRSSRLFRARGEERQRVFAAADALRREVNGDDGHLRRDAEHPVHERLLLPLRLLRVLEGQARREPARRAVPRPARGDRPPRRGGVGARRDRGLPPGRDPSGVRRRLLRLGRARDQGRGAGDARARVQRARDLAGRGDARRPARRLPRAAARRGARARCPGTAAEVLDDEVRAVICPDKITTAQWLEVHDTAHAVGLRSNNTIMFGHVDGPRNWARHLVAVRELQRRTGGFTEFVPLPFVPHGGADLPPGPRAPRADVRRGAAHARGRPARAPSVDREHPGVVGEGSARAASRRRCAPASTTSAAR